MALPVSVSPPYQAARDESAMAPTPSEVAEHRGVLQPVAPGEAAEALLDPTLEEDPQLERTLRCDRDSPFAACAVVPGRPQILTGAQDGSMFVWPVGPGWSRPTLLGGHQGTVTCVCASSSGEIFASSSTDSTVMLWRNQSSRQTPAVVKVHFSTVRSCDISHNERLLLTSSDDKMVKLCALPSRRFVASLVGHSNWVRTARFSPKTAAHIVSGSDDKTVRLWSVERREPMRIWYDCSGGVTDASFDTEENAVVACSLDSTINIWDTRTQGLRQHYGRAHGSSPITRVTFHPTRDLLLSTSVDRTLRIWDLRGGRLRSTIFGHEQPVHEGCWSPDGSRIISCDGGAINVWRFSTTLGQKSSTLGGGSMPAAVGSGSAPAAGRRQSSAGALHRRLAADAHAAPKELASGPGSPRAMRKKANHASAPGRPHSVPPAGRSPLVAGLRHQQQQPQPQPQHTSACEPLGQTHSGKVPSAATPAELKPSTVRASADDATTHTPCIASEGMSRSRESLAGLPEALARTMEQLVSQLDVVTQTLQSLESRIGVAEVAIAELAHLVVARRQGSLHGNGAVSYTAAGDASSLSR